jgi:ribonucleoside-diphosphate reductase alpha chain
MQVYVDAWKFGLKAVAIYRDGSKRTQPLSVDRDAQTGRKVPPAEAISREQLEAARREPHRQRLPDTRPSLTHKFDVAGHEGYMTVGLYDEGQPGELFIAMAKEGSTVGGMMDAFATAISLCLQYGVPLQALVKKFSHQRFEPSGMTSNKDIPFAKSIVDYLFRWLGMRFLEEYHNANTMSRPASAEAPAGRAVPEAVKDDITSWLQGAGRAGDREAPAAGAGLYMPGGAAGGDGGNGGSGPQPAGQTLSLETRAALAHERIDRQFSHFQEDAPACDVCGSITVRNGNCYKCFNCGSSLGCS